MRKIHQIGHLDRLPDDCILLCETRSNSQNFWFLLLFVSKYHACGSCSATNFCVYARLPGVEMKMVMAVVDSPNCNATGTSVPRKLCLVVRLQCQEAAQLSMSVVFCCGFVCFILRSASLWVPSVHLWLPPRACRLVWSKQRQCQRCVNKLGLLLHFVYCNNAVTA